MSKMIVLTGGAALMVVAGWLGSALAEDDRASRLDEIQRSHAKQSASENAPLVAMVRKVSWPSAWGPDRTNQVLPSS